MKEAGGRVIANGCVDAAVPVLFMRLPDGRLWNVAAAKKERSSMPESEKSKSAKQVNVNARAVNVANDLVGGNVITQTGGPVQQINRTGSNQGKSINQSGGISIDNSGDQFSKKSGGVNLGGAGQVTIGGNVVGEDFSISSTGGDVVQGNKIIVSSGSKYVGGDDNSVTGWSAKDVENFFAKVTQKIDAKPELAPTDKEDLKAEVQDLQTEVAKGEEANESFLERRLRNIKRMAPDILETIATTLADPKAGLAMVIRKVMIKAKAGA
jgi:hypothetical protein